jgi:hypothetical protein
LHIPTRRPEVLKLTFLSRLRPRSGYDVVAVIAMFAALGTGGAYAAATIGSDEVVDESLTDADNWMYQPVDPGYAYIPTRAMTQVVGSSNDQLRVVAQGRTSSMEGGRVGRRRCRVAAHRAPIGDLGAYSTRKATTYELVGVQPAAGTLAPPLSMPKFGPARRSSV